MPRNTWQCPCGKRNSLNNTKCRLCGLVRLSDDFDHLVDFLEANGFNVEVEETDYQVCYFDNKHIRGGFATYGFGSNYLDGKVAADNKRCFNKWSQCPLVVAIPKDDKSRAKLLEYFAFLGSKEGLRWSTKFEYLDDPRLPREP